jgi:hypothetical protein
LPKESLLGDALPLEQTLSSGVSVRDSLAARGLLVAADREEKEVTLAGKPARKEKANERERERERETRTWLPLLVAAGSCSTWTPLCASLASSPSCSEINLTSLHPTSPRLTPAHLTSPQSRSARHLQVR